ncbi:hypothetical protein K8R20_02495 [bacterium]|nr:hypothetical protein [bacterium]
MDKSIWNGIGVIGTVTVGLVSLLLFCNMDLHFSDGGSVPIILRVGIFVIWTILLILVFGQIGYEYLYILSWLIIIGMFFISEVSTLWIEELMQELEGIFKIIEKYIQ